jgi:hypothetical protein
MLESFRRCWLPAPLRHSRAKSHAYQTKRLNALASPRSRTCFEPRSTRSADSPPCAASKKGGASSYFRRGLATTEPERMREARSGGGKYKGHGDRNDSGAPFGGRELRATRYGLRATDGLNEISFRSCFDLGHFTRCCNSDCQSNRPLSPRRVLELRPVAACERRLQRQQDGGHRRYGGGRTLVRTRLRGNATFGWGLRIGARKVLQRSNRDTRALVQFRMGNERASARSVSPSRSNQQPVDTGRVVNSLRPPEHKRSVPDCRGPTSILRCSDSRTRTLDPAVNSRLLYQLS